MPTKPPVKPPEKQRVPEAAGNIQVNFCKNPQCLNYARPMSNKPQPRGTRGTAKPKDVYKICGDKRGTPEIQCLRCNEILPLKSNLGILEETERLGDYLKPETSIGCPDVACPNHELDVKRSPNHYMPWGSTRAKSLRYRCKACGKTFSVGGPSLRQKKPHKNREVFSLLVNKMAIRRIIEHSGISASSVYGKIDFIHSQCLAFVARRERKLLDGFPIERLNISVDRQEYVVNWKYEWDKRNIRLQAVGSADNNTGYVFGMHVNFDPRLNPGTVEDETTLLGDEFKQKPYRRHARIWLASDYIETAKRSAVRRKGGYSMKLTNEIVQSYQAAEERDDVEAPEQHDPTTKLPADGVQVHAEYTLYGHFFLLKRLFGGVGKVRFYLDQESGIRAACLAAFADEILARRCDAFYVRINKDMTVNERRRMVRMSKWELEKYEYLYPYLNLEALRMMIILERVKNMQPIGKWNDKWLDHPFPKMNEPEKAVAYLTDMGDYEVEHLARLYARASLHGIDRFFMQVRRMLSMTERPIGTASNRGRTWYGYSPYNPIWMIKMLDIFRVFYNYCKVGNDGMTPAMRLGLAKSRNRIEDIIYYS